MVLPENRNDLFLFYGVYNTRQLLINNLEFIPCIFENKYPWKHEFQIYKTIYNLVESSQEDKDNIYGLFSSSVTQRTGLNYQSICNLIKENDADIFIFSPWQYNSLIFYNYWDQAEICHQGIREELKQIFSLNKNLPKLDFNCKSNKREFSYCNFWAAKKDFFLKIVKDMMFLDELMIDNNLGLKETTHTSPYIHKFNKSFKKNYKYFPFIIERYLSATLMDRDYKLAPKVFYWNDIRKIQYQVENIKGFWECFKEPIKRGIHYQSIKMRFKNKKDFYKKIWFKEDLEKLDKLIQGASERLISL